MKQRHSAAELPDAGREQQYGNEEKTGILTAF